MVKTSYPLAKISAHYKVDINLVCFAADYLAGRGNNDQGRSAYNRLPLIVTNQLCEVRDQLRDFQAGYSNWEEGHVLVLF